MLPGGSLSVAGEPKLASGSIPTLCRKRAQPQQSPAFRALARYLDQLVDLVDEVVHVFRSQKRVAIWVDAAQKGEPFVAGGQDSIKVARGVKAASSRVRQTCHHT